MIALPLATARLVVRRFTDADAEALAAYRSHPDVARFQNWDPPYTVDDARELIAGSADSDLPALGEWVQVGVEHGGALIGDVGVFVDSGGGVAEVGYSLHPDHQGNGFATEAVGAVVDALLAGGVHRVEAGVDPENVASRRLLERLGFEREGLARRAYRLRDHFVDDERWALLADDRARWLARPHTLPSEMRLVELGEKPRTYGRLRVHPSQEGFVATVLHSYADALFPELDPGGGLLVPWLRGVEGDGEPVGFVMVSEATPTSPEPFLWRLLVDRGHQGRGIGRWIVDQVGARARELGHTTLLTSWVEGPGSPRPFYLGLGFEPTGEIEDGETVARLHL